MELNEEEEEVIACIGTDEQQVSVIEFEERVVPVSNVTHEFVEHRVMDVNENNDELVYSEVLAGDEGGFPMPKTNDKFDLIKRENDVL